MKKLTDEDFKNLEAIFALARKEASANESQLIQIISFKKMLFDKLKFTEEKPTEE